MVQASSNQDFLGFGVTRPFRRDKKGDFASAGGAALVISAVGQILGTRGAVPGAAQQGEVPWRSGFGSLIHTLKHAPNNTILRELARTHTLDALKRWEPRIIVKSVDAKRIDVESAGLQRGIEIKVKFNLIASNVPGNEVLFSEDLIATVAVPTS